MVAEIAEKKPRRLLWIDCPVASTHWCRQTRFAGKSKGRAEVLMQWRRQMRFVGKSPSEFAGEDDSVRDR